jgi:hypothetical protein
MHLVVPPPLPAARKAVRDLLVELSQTRSLKQAINDIVEDILGHATESDPYLKRRKWCLATIYSRAELAEHVEYHLRNSGLAFATHPAFIAGEQDERHTASAWEAWFGVGGGFLGTGIGATFGTVTAENVDWGDTVYDTSFPTEQAMQDYLDAHAASDPGHYGWYYGSDGRWHVVWVGKDVYSI